MDQVAPRCSARLEEPVADEGEGVRYMIVVEGGGGTDAELVAGPPPWFIFHFISFA